MAALDYTAFPHIVERVLSLSDWTAKLRLRSLSRGVRDRLDADLYYHIVVCLGDAPPQRRSVTAVAAVLYSPCGRRLPLVAWEQYRSVMERADARRKLSYVRVVDWGPHLLDLAPNLFTNFPIEGAGDPTRAPLLNLFAEAPVMRYTDMLDLPACLWRGGPRQAQRAETHAVFINVTSSGSRADPAGPGPWLFWVQCSLYHLPPARKVVLHVRFDPQHPKLACTHWNLPRPQLRRMTELVILLRPAEDLPCALPVDDVGERRLGFLDGLLEWAGLFLVCGTRVTVVGMDALSDDTLCYHPGSPGGERSRAQHIKAAVNELARMGVEDWERAPREEGDSPVPCDRKRIENANEHIEWISWDEFAKQTSREEYALYVVRPHFDTRGRWPDDHKTVYPRAGAEGESHLDGLQDLGAHPPLSPMLPPVSGS